MLRHVMDISNRFDPPDLGLTVLAAEINKKARQGKVMFVSRQGDVSAIFSDGPKRAVLTLGGRPSEVDIDDLVRALESWAGFRSDVVRYSTEVPPAPESSWS